MSSSAVCPDGKPRCKWSLSAPDFIDYHDKEWGFPVSDDRILFEKICLEGFQSGLSWRTILAKREDFRIAFKNFEIEKVARYNTRSVEKLLTNEGIVRHRGKIEATINNAKKAIDLIEEKGSLASFFWHYEPDPSDVDPPQTVSVSKESTAISKELKKRGWKFVGPTTVFAFMQAMGLINDHVHGCCVREKVEEARNKFKRP